jgi:dimethylglycine dehydrogenase
VALGYIPTHLADGSAGVDGFEVEILGRMRPARLQLEPLYDPDGERMRG